MFVCRGRRFKYVDVLIRFSVYVADMFRFSVYVAGMFRFGLYSRYVSVCLCVCAREAEVISHNTCMNTGVLCVYVQGPTIK